MNAKRTLWGTPIASAADPDEEPVLSLTPCSQDGFDRASGDAFSEQ
jgi:hypothetical protein